MMRKENGGVWKCNKDILRRMEVRIENSGVWKGNKKILIRIKNCHIYFNNSFSKNRNTLWANIFSLQVELFQAWVKE